MEFGKSERRANEKLSKEKRGGGDGVVSGQGFGVRWNEKLTRVTQTTGVNINSQKGVSTPQNGSTSSKLAVEQETHA